LSNRTDEEDKRAAAGRSGKRVEGGGVGVAGGVGSVTAHTREDARRNRQRLLAAAGLVMREAPSEASVPRIARQAGLSVATAYRYFPTLDNLLNAYLHQVYVQLRDFSRDARARERQLHTVVAAEWLRLVGIYGRSMVQLRPRTGLLERLHSGDLVVTTSREAWERPLRALLRSSALPEDLLEPAFFFQNLLFDAREVLDLRDQGMDEVAVTTTLQASLVGAVQGWQAAGSHLQWSQLSQPTLQKPGDGHG
jgi:AcrR family transcriptional regulator